MRILAVFAILSVVFASDSEFLFKSEAEVDTNLFKVPSSEESFLQQENPRPSTFAWWTGFVDNDPALEKEAWGEWRDPVYVHPGYHGCGFNILYDYEYGGHTTYNKSGIAELYLIACNPNAPSGSPKRRYYQLTFRNFMDYRIDYEYQSEEIICDEDSAIQQYNIRYRRMTPNTDNMGASGLWIICTKGGIKIHEPESQVDTKKWGEWMPQSRSWNGSQYYVCGAKTKYRWGYHGDIYKVSFIDLAICSW
jgi:hypothetical protein